MTLHLTRGKVVTNNNPSFWKCLNCPKLYNSGASRSLTPGELILDNTPKCLTLVTSHHNKVLTWNFLLHIVQHPHHDLRYIHAYIFFNCLVSVALSSVGRENLKSSGTREKTMLWKLFFAWKIETTSSIKIFSALNTTYIYIYGTIDVHLCCVSFSILIDSVILLSPLMSPHMQASKAYDKYYRFHFYIIRLIYISMSTMGFTYIYIYIY